MSDIRELEEVVLLVDRPEDGLRAGDVGTAVHVYADGSAEVEVVLPSGKTHALVTLSPHAFRALGPEDVPSVRPAGG